MQYTVLAFARRAAGYGPVVSSTDGLQHASMRLEIGGDGTLSTGRKASDYR
jgi:hypothetical protein